MIDQATYDLYMGRFGAAMRRVSQDVARGLSPERHDVQLIARYATLAQQLRGTVEPAPAGWVSVTA